LILSQQAAISCTKNIRSFFNLEMGLLEGNIGVTGPLFYLFSIANIVKGLNAIEKKIKVKISKRGHTVA
jgi:hypothetical protein